MANRPALRGFQLSLQCGLKGHYSNQLGEDVTSDPRSPKGHKLNDFSIS